VRAGSSIRATTQSTETVDGSGHTQLPSKAPIGRWKDGLCDWVCHVLYPVFWVPYFCHLVALGQVMTRLQLNWKGRPGTANAVRQTFKIMLNITILFTVINWIGSAVFGGTVGFEEEKAYDNNLNVITIEKPIFVPSDYNVEFHHISVFLLYVFTGILMMRTRHYLRSRYHIPKSVDCLANYSTSGCGHRVDCEDCVCSFFCQCCVVSQMMRHTADYDTYAAKYCTPTGLASHVPTDPFIIESEDQNSLQLNVI